MTREQRLINIFNAFDKYAESLYRDTNASSFEIIPTHKGSRTDAQSLKYRRAYIFYNSFAVELKYTAHSTMSLTNSILECLLIPDKSMGGIAIPLPLFLDYCNQSTPTPLCIPSILDEHGMEQAFTCICGVFKDSLDLISNICGDESKKKSVLDAFIGEMSALLKVEINDNNIEYYITESLYSFLTLRLTSAHFINYIKGDTSNAIKQLSKVKDRLGYESRMLMMWQEDTATSDSDLSSVREALKAYNKSGVQNASSGKEFIAMFLSWLALCVGFSAIYCGFFFLLVYFEGISSIYLMGPIYSFPYCILFGFISAIAMSYFTRFKFYKLLFPKDYERYCAIDQVQNGEGADKLMKGFLTVIVVCAVAGSILLAKWNVNFKEYGFVDNTKFLSLVGEYHDYEEIDRIYYKADRINGFGEKLDFPSYVIVMKNGKEIDLYEHDEIEEYEDTLIKTLKEKGVRIDGPEK